MKELSIIVCAKQIPDPEAPLSDVSVDAEKMEVIVDAPQVISPFDENALEAAIRIKEEMDAKIRERFPIRISESAMSAGGRVGG